MARRRVSKKGPVATLLSFVGTYTGLVIDTVLEVLYALKTELVMVACTLVIVAAIENKPVEPIELPSVAYADANKVPQLTPAECDKLDLQLGMVYNGIMVLLKHLVKIDGLKPNGESYIRYELKPEMIGELVKLCPHFLDRRIDDVKEPKEVDNDNG